MWLFTALTKDEEHAQGNKRFLFVFAILLSTVGILGLTLHISLLERIFLPTQHPDFFDYFAAFQLFKAGKDPYNILAIEDVVASLPYAAPGWHLIRMYYPPWTLVLFTPMLAWTMAVSSFLWVSCSIFCLYAGALYLSESFRIRIPLAAVIFAASSSAPAFEVFLWGQSGLFVFLGHALFLSLVAIRRDFFAGLILCLVLIKFHLFAIFLFALLLWILSEKRFMILLGVLTGMVSLLGVACFVSPKILYHYSQMKHEMLPYAFTLKSANLASFMRQFVWTSAEMAPPVWPIYAMLVFGLLLVLFLFVSMRRKVTVRLIYVLVLPLSLVCSPLTWFHDCVSMLIGQLLLFFATYEEGIRKSHKRMVLIGFLLVQLTGFVGKIALNDSSEFWWFPLMNFAVGLYVAFGTDIGRHIQGRELIVGPSPC